MAVLAIPICQSVYFYFYLLWFMQWIVIITPCTKYNCSWNDDSANRKWLQFSLREVSVCQLSSVMHSSC
jgi:hypothetical protein